MRRSKAENWRLSRAFSAVSVVARVVLSTTTTTMPRRGARSAALALTPPPPPRAAASSPQADLKHGASSPSTNKSPKLQRKSTHKKTTFFYNDEFEFPLPATHRFPMAKYRLVREALQSELSDDRGVAFERSPLVTEADLLTTHAETYVRKFVRGELSREENREIGFPWSDAGVARALSSTGGTVAAARFVADAMRDDEARATRRRRPREEEEKFRLVEEAVNPSSSRTFRVAGHVAGGTHHATRDRGEGFCVFSDIAVAANVLLRDFSDVCSRILICDLDVHQGNGNAKLFEHDPRVFTFSLHAADNLHFHAARPAFSDCDVALPTGADDEIYLRMLKAYLPLLKRVDPDLVFYQAGVDPSEHDRLGKLNISRQGLQKRNDLVFDAFKRLGVPVVVTMGGGYPRDLDPASESYQEIVSAHVDVYKAAAHAAATPHA